MPPELFTFKGLLVCNVNYISIKIKCFGDHSGEKSEVISVALPHILTGYRGSLLSPPSKTSLPGLRCPHPWGHCWGVCSWPPTSAGLWLPRPIEPAVGPDYRGRDLTTAVFTHDITLSPRKPALWVQGSQGAPPVFISFCPKVTDSFFLVSVPGVVGRLGPSVCEPSDHI